MAVFLLLGVTLAAIVGSASKTWQLESAHNERRAIATTVFGQMNRDLAAAALPTDVSGSQLDFAINPAGLSATLLPQAVFCLTPTATDTSHGSLAAVGYFVQWVTDGSSSTPKLCRYFANPSAVSIPPSYNLVPGTWTDASLVANAPATRGTNYAGMLAENVLGLWIQPLDQKNQPITVEGDGASTPFGTGQFDASKGYVASTGRTYPAYNSSYSTTGAPAGYVSLGALPASVQVAIVCVDSRTALLLNSANAKEKPAAVTGNFWGDVNNFYTNLPPAIYRGAEIESTTIDLANAPR
jgi:hypothetical protein